MGMYRPLRGILLGYECVRLVVLLGAIGGTASAGAVFPTLVYGVANALFLLMVLFVWLDPVRYGVYAPLYTAGKAISVVSALGWCIFSWDRIINAMFIDNSGVLIMLGGLLCLVVGDILSACGEAVLLNKLKRVEAAAKSAAAEPVSDEPAIPPAADKEYP